MGKYTIRVEKTAAQDLKKLYKSGKKADIAKVERIFKELSETPQSGIGEPKKLTGDLLGFWSRRINKKDRVVYEIIESDIVVVVISAIGHYSAK